MPDPGNITPQAPVTTSPVTVSRDGLPRRVCSLRAEGLGRGTSRAESFGHGSEDFATVPLFAHLAGRFPPFPPAPPSCSGSRPEIFGTRLEKPQFKGPDESLARKFPRRKHPIFSTDENRSSPPKSRRVELRRLPTACLRARAFRDPDHFVEDPTGKGIAGLSHPEFIEALSRYGASPIQRGRAVLECEVETAMGSVADSSDTAEEGNE